MVTGSTGSIGSELCQQILELGSKQLILVDHREFILYIINQDLQHRCINLEDKFEICALLGSVQDRILMDRILEKCKPHAAYHAAASKLVPLVEEKPVEGV